MFFFLPPAQISLALVRWEGKLLLLQRPEGDWAFPSVHLEKDEPFLSGAERAAKEYAAIDVSPTNLLAIHTRPRTDREVFYVLCDHKNGDPCNIKPDEVQALAWVSPVEALKRLSPPLFEPLEEHLRPTRQTGSKMIFTS